MRLREHLEDSVPFMDQKFEIGRQVAKKAVMERMKVAMHSAVMAYRKGLICFVCLAIRA
jgi:hypothetical protein